MDQFEDVKGVIFENTLTNRVDEHDDDEEMREYHSRIKERVADARDFEESELAPVRETADEYYKGIRPGLSDDDVEDDNLEAGRSTVVATEVRDTVMAIMPSLIRIFTSSEHPVEFVPTNKYTVELAAQQTEYVSYVFFEDNDGFMNLYSGIMDALNKNIGVYKWWTDNDVTVTKSSYRDITAEQAQFVLAQPGVEMVEYEQFPPVKEGAEPTFDLHVQKVDQSNRTKITVIPPEEFRIDRNAKSIACANLVGHERLESVSTLAMMGYDPEWLRENYPIGDGENMVSTVERQLRSPGALMTADWHSDDMVLFGEFWIRIDQDGDGIEELHYIHMIGEEVVRDEIVSRPKMALICPDPEPHSAIGHSINEGVQDIQRIKTNILRTTLDGLAQSIHGRMGVVENQVNMDDVLNDDIGAPIRMKSINAIQPIQSSFLAQPALEMMGYLDTIRQARTGISEASKGLDPRALQSTNVNAVDMVITGAQERIELIARILAETGFRDIFKGLLIEITENPNKARTIKLRGEWVEVMPDAFDPTMGIRVNPAIGRGSDLDRFNMLGQIAAKQEAIMQQFGPINPFVTYNEAMNTITDMLSIAGIKNTNRYFKNPPPEEVQKFMEGQNKPDPAMMLAQSEMEKNKVALAKTIAETEQTKAKTETDDDFRRDKLEADVALKAAEIGIDALSIFDRMKLDRDKEGNVQGNIEADRQLDMFKHADQTVRDDTRDALDRDERAAERAAAEAAERQAGSTGNGSAS